jgi:phage terminase small subunit
MTDTLPNHLTTKQRVFVETYLANGFNATAAAREAGYKYPNVRGAENVAKSSIREVIDARLRAMTMTADEVLKLEDDIARFNISEYLNTEGRLTGLKLQKMIDDGYGHLIRAIKHTAHGTVIEWASPDDARDRLLKARGAYRQNLDITSGGEKIKAVVVLKEDEWNAI